MTPDDPRHGTYAGHCTHQREGHPDCEPCRLAHNAYMRDRRKNNPDARAATLRANSARTRALWRLAALYPDDFRRLYLIEIGPPLMADTATSRKATP